MKVLLITPSSLSHGDKKCLERQGVCLDAWSYIVLLPDISNHEFVSLMCRLARSNGYIVWPSINFYGRRYTVGVIYSNGALLKSISPGSDQVKSSNFADNLDQYKEGCKLVDLYNDIINSMYNNRE